MVARHYNSRGWRHAYRKYEDLVRRHMAPAAVVCDVGCGRSFEMARFLLDCGVRPHGIDPLGATASPPSGAVVKVGSAYDIPYDDNAFDMIICRSLLEHLKWPEAAFREFQRALRPSGRIVFLTANRCDYASMGAMLVPNAWHGKVVKWMEGRDESDTFPTFYRANTARAIRRLAGAAGLHVESLEYYNTYPSYLMFSGLLCRLAIAYDELIRQTPSLHWLQAWIVGVLTKT
jgi:SAM-dependent methyltransferase